MISVQNAKSFGLIKGSEGRKRGKDREMEGEECVGGGDETGCGGGGGVC
jgi:hypothetical protein